MVFNHLQSVKSRSLRHNRLRPVWITCLPISQLWNCFSWFSITFKVPQVSVLFNFQGPACSPLGQLIYYIKGHTLCQALFWYFFELSVGLFKSFSPARCPVPRCVFAGVSLLFSFRWAAVSRDSLFIIPHFQKMSTPFFRFFSYFFEFIFGQDVYGVFLFSPPLHLLFLKVFAFCPFI